MARTTLLCHYCCFCMVLERYRYSILRKNSRAKFVEKQRGQPKFGCLFARSFVLEPFAVVQWRRRLSAWRRVGPLRCHPRSRSRLRGGPILYLRPTLRLWPVLHRWPIVQLRAILVPVVVVFLRAIVIVPVIPSVVRSSGSLRRRREGTESIVRARVSAVRVSTIGSRICPCFFR